MREHVGYAVKNVSDHAHKELSADEVLEIFTREYVNIESPLSVSDCHFVRKGEQIKAMLTVVFNGEEMDIADEGNGRLDAVSNAFKRNLGIGYHNLTYTEHALESGSTSKAVTYVGLTDDSGKTHWGAGVHEDIITSSIQALVSAINIELA